VPADLAAGLTASRRAAQALIKPAPQAIVASGDLEPVDCVHLGGASAKCVRTRLRGLGPDRRHFLGIRTSSRSAKPRHLTHNLRHSPEKVSAPSHFDRESSGTAVLRGSLGNGDPCDVFRTRDCPSRTRRARRSSEVTATDLTASRRSRRYDGREAKRRPGARRSWSRGSRGSGRGRARRSRMARRRVGARPA
jgi:hypothetical protein